MISSPNAPATHVLRMDAKYEQEIASSARLTQKHDDNSFDRPLMDGYLTGLRNAVGKGEIVLTDKGSTDAVISEQPNGKVCVLNFADYLTPGGMFLMGSLAQEESLCATSTLYNVISRMNDWYKENRGSINRGLWSNRALYSPDVIFPHKGEAMKADVITCAAPNAWKWMNETTSPENKELHEALVSRLEFVLKVAALNAPDVLILGAYGCGAFGNDAEEVAGIFNELLTGKYKNTFKRVVFAIPYSNGKNYGLFKKALASITKEE